MTNRTFPSAQFNHAQAFLEMTRKAVYDVEGYVEDHGRTQLQGISTNFRRELQVISTPS